MRNFSISVYHVMSITSKIVGASLLMMGFCALFVGVMVGVMWVLSQLITHYVIGITVLTILAAISYKGYRYERS